MRRNKLKHCCFSSNDSFIHGNPWLLSSMSCKSRLHIVEKDKVEISHFLSIKTRSSVFLKLIPYFGFESFFETSKVPLGSSLIFCQDFSFGGWSERLQQFMSVCGDSLQFNLGQYRFWEVVRVKWATFVSNPMLTINTMIGWCWGWWWGGSSGVSGEVGRSWRYCNTRPTRDEAGASSWTSSPCKNQFNIEGGTWPPYQILSW